MCVYYCICSIRHECECVHLCTYMYLYFVCMWQCAMPQFRRPTHMDIVLVLSLPGEKCELKLVTVTLKVVNGSRRPASCRIIWKDY